MPAGLSGLELASLLATRDVAKRRGLMNSRERRRVLAVPPRTTTHRCSLCGKPFDPDPHSDIAVRYRDMTFREAWEVLKYAAGYAFVYVLMIGLSVGIVFGAWRVADNAAGRGVLSELFASPIAWVVIAIAMCWPLHWLVADTLTGLGVFAATAGATWVRTSLRGRIATIVILGAVMAGFTYLPTVTGIALAVVSSISTALQDWKTRKRAEIIESRTESESDV